MGRQWTWQNFGICNAALELNLCSLLPCTFVCTTQVYNMWTCSIIAPVGTLRYTVLRTMHTQNLLHSRLHMPGLSVYARLMLLPRERKSRDMYLSQQQLDSSSKSACLSPVLATSTNKQIAFSLHIDSGGIFHQGITVLFLIICKRFIRPYLD